MKLSASQAAKQTGKSVPTITRAIKSGKISAEKTSAGGYQIEASELFRVFSAVIPETDMEDNTLPIVTPNETADFHEKRLLEERLEILEAALSDAKAERDEWRDQAKRLALALPPPSEEKPPVKRRWWKRK